MVVAWVSTTIYDVLGPCPVVVRASHPHITCVERADPEHHIWFSFLGEGLFGLKIRFSPRMETTRNSM